MADVGASFQDLSEAILRHKPQSDLALSHVNPSMLMLPW